MNWRRVTVGIQFCGLDHQPKTYTKNGHGNHERKSPESHGMRYFSGTPWHRLCSLSWLGPSSSRESGELNVCKPCLEGKHPDYSNCPECDVSLRIKGQWYSSIWLLSLTWGGIPSTGKVPLAAAPPGGT